LLLSAPFSGNLFAGSRQDQGKALFERFQSHLAEIVDRQPGYACQASTERTARLASKGKPIARDRVRFGIAASGSNESYSWPDGGNLDKNAVEQIAQGEAGGMNGVSAWSRALLALPASPGAGSTDCNVKGRRGVRFDFQTPWASSSYHIIAGARRIVVPYAASVCADAGTLDPMQLEVRAGLASGPIASVVETIAYEPTRIGTAETPLPVSRELRVTDRDGGERLNVTEYSAFQPYSEPAAADARQSASGPPVPAGIDLDIKLDTAISFEDSAVADPFTARLQTNIHKGGLNAPKGTQINGRIGRLEERFVPEHHYVVGLDLLTLKLDGASVNCRARLTGPELKYDKRPESVVGFGDPNYMPPIWDTRGLEIENTDPTARFGVFRVRGVKLRIAPGLHMIWQTLETKAGDNVSVHFGTKP
jgi:hypothetical protein